MARQVYCLASKTPTETDKDPYDGVTFLLAGSVCRWTHVVSGKSRWHAGDWASSPWTHVHSRAFVDRLPSRTAGQLPPGPSAQRKPRHTSPEVAASRLYERLSS